MSPSGHPCKSGCQCPLYYKSDPGNHQQSHTRVIQKTRGVHSGSVRTHTHTLHVGSSSHPIFRALARARANTAERNSGRAINAAARSDSASNIPLEATEGRYSQKIGTNSQVSHPSPAQPTGSARRGKSLSTRPKRHRVASWMVLQKYIPNNKCVPRKAISNLPTSSEVQRIPT